MHDQSYRRSPFPLTLNFLSQGDGRNVFKAARGEMRQGGGERSARRGVDTIRGDGAEKSLNEEAPTRRA